MKHTNEEIKLYLRSKDYKLEELERILLYSKVLTKKDFWREYVNTHSDEMRNRRGNFKLDLAWIESIHLSGRNEYKCLVSQPDMSLEGNAYFIEVTTKEIKDYLKKKSEPFVEKRCRKKAANNGTILNREK
ncbi:MAG: hypothetical protein PHD81_01560 [Candidatus Nanoarchaeia archaeon]|nr:hypothetical protein [Candidatus Nanoarchaeia archaeon]MDD5587775.1 hypothetical protein [Candidatus Nanoarchaeia archaeon]